MMWGCQFTPRCPFNQIMSCLEITLYNLRNFLIHLPGCIYQDIECWDCLSVNHKTGQTASNFVTCKVTASQCCWRESMALTERVVVSRVLTIEKSDEQLESWSNIRVIKVTAEKCLSSPFRSAFMLNYISFSSPLFCLLNWLSDS